jgi:hypothetical protein
MKIREHLKQIRAGLKQLFSHSIYEAAAFNKLAIEYWEGMPAHYEGHLDTTNEQPRFIAVNKDLQIEDQVYAIAREIGRYNQLCGRNSPLICGPRQWNLLATAPTETRDFILSLDVEVRAYWIMFWHANKNTFCGIPKRHPKTYHLGSYASAISDYLFLKLRIRNLLFGILSTFRFVHVPHSNAGRIP